MMHYLGMALVGFVVGLIARAVLPGSQNMGLLMTAILGIAGSVVAGFIGQAVGWYHAGEGASFIASIVGAMLVVFIYGKITASQGGSSSS